MKSQATVISLSSILVLSLAGCCGQMRSCPRQVLFQPSEPDCIRVMTFNIRTATILDLWNHWAFRKGSVIDSMANNAPDIIGVQEAKSSQVRDIQKALPQYCNYAVGRMNGRDRGETNAVFYRKDRFILQDSGTFWFSDTPDKPGSSDWGNIYPRLCTWVYLVERNTGQGFYVYNMHLDVFSQNSRERSTELLARKVEMRKTSDPFILMGDFNMKEENPAMSHLSSLGCRGAGCSPHSTQQNVGTRRAFLGLGTSPRIDHIRLSDGLSDVEVRVDKRQVHGRYPSDHYPLIATIRLDTAS